jgi:hypothetical protein
LLILDKFSVVTNGAGIFCKLIINGLHINQKAFGNLQLVYYCEPFDLNPLKDKIAPNLLVSETTSNHPIPKHWDQQQSLQNLFKKARKTEKWQGTF